MIPEMELLTELLNEWRRTMEVIKNKATEVLQCIEKNGLKETATKPKEKRVRKKNTEKKENVKKPKVESNAVGREGSGIKREEPDEMLFGCESLMPSPIPVVKNKNVVVEEGLGKEGSKENTYPAKDEAWVIPEGTNDGDMYTDKGSNPPGYKHTASANIDAKTLEARPRIAYMASKLKKPSFITCGMPDDAENVPERDNSENVRNAVQNNASKAEVKDRADTKTDLTNVAANIKLNTALMQLKKRYLEKVNESMYAGDRSVFQGVKDTPQDSKKQEFKRPVFNVSSAHQSNRNHNTKTSGRVSDDCLYRQAIDNQLLKTTGNGKPQHIHKPKTKIPKLDEDSDTIADPSFVVPAFAKDPTINFKVKTQDHDILEKHFSSGYEIDVEKLFPHIRNVSNDSPNKWPR